MRSRRASSGFTLLEALLAAAVLALMALPIISAFSNAAQQDGPRIAQFAKYEFAVSLLQERIATNDLSEGAGVYEERFSYNVSADAYVAKETTRYDDLISHTRLTIVVDTVGTDDRPVTVTQVIARAADR